MRLSYTSTDISSTTLVDNSGRQLYATTSSTYGGKTEITKFGRTGDSSQLALLLFRNTQPDTITIDGQKHVAESYITRPSWWSHRRLFTPSSGYTYEWIRKGSTWRMRLQNDREVGRSHSRSLGLRGTKHPPYLEFSDDSNVLIDLDELVTTFVYLQLRREIDQRSSTQAGSATGMAGAV